MIPVVISATAYTNNQPACLQRVREIIQSKPCTYTGLLLDDNFSSNITTSSASVSATYINISDWINDLQQPLKVEMRTQANKLNKEHIIVLDARHHDPQLISTILHEAALIWYHLDCWQPAFVLVVDDYHAPLFVRELSGTFNIQPLSNSKQAIAAEIHAMRSQIRRYRWLGFGRLSQLLRLLQTCSLKIKQNVIKQFS